MYLVKDGEAQLMVHIMEEENVRDGSDQQTYGIVSEPVLCFAILIRKL